MLYGSPAFPCMAETAPNDIVPTLQHDKNNDLTYYSDEEDVCCRPSEFPLTAEEIDRHIDEFINNIDEEAIGQLASRHNDQKPWKRIAGRTHGSFNVCFFVQFDDDTTLVVRIPLNPVVIKSGQRSRAKSPLYSNIAFLVHHYMHYWHIATNSI